MHEIVKDILQSYNMNETEECVKALEKLEEDIAFAKEIVSGKRKRCEKCDDYYLVNSFQHSTETTEGKICTYQDPINSGGNEYADGCIHREYEICPKGHKHLIRQWETRK